MSLTAWSRLIRYVSAQDGKIRWGEPLLNQAQEDPSTQEKSTTGTKTDLDIDFMARNGTLLVDILEGLNPFVATHTGEQDQVGKLLGPLSKNEVPIIRCIGLNYKTHIAETGFDQPVNPTLFFKPSTCVADTRVPTSIPPLGQAQCDYEGEFTIVIGKDGRNISPENALDYVAGYTAGNDVSCRDWQMQSDKAGMMPQWGFSKSFDGYAPLGPCLVSPKLLQDGSGLKVETFVNGELRQSSSTDDLCFGVRKLVSFLSTGQTLQAGSVIMTGTPGGVGLGFKPPKFLKDGDEVAVVIEGIGRMSTVMEFEKS